MFHFAVPVLSRGAPSKTAGAGLVISVTGPA